MHTNNVNPDMKNWSKLLERNSFCQSSSKIRSNILPLNVEIVDFNLTFSFRIDQKDKIHL